MKTKKIKVKVEKSKLSLLFETAVFIIFGLLALNLPIFAVSVFFLGSFTYFYFAFTGISTLILEIIFVIILIDCLDEFVIKYEEREIIIER